MSSKTRYIPLVIVGAILLSLLAIVPAFGADEVGFIDPNDINDSDGTLSDSTPDDQEWARQGGRIGLMLSDDGLNTAVKRVLIPSMDARSVGTGDVRAHKATISSTAAVSGLSVGDYVLIGINAVRKVESVNSDANTITVDKAFGTGMSYATIYRINDSVTALSPWNDNYSSYAMAEMISAGDVTTRGSVYRYNALHAIVDSDIAKGVGASVTPLNRISGSGTGSINTGDVLVVNASGSSVAVDDVSGDRIEFFNVNPAGAYLVYWAEERNETGSVVTVRSQAHRDPVTVVLTETTPRSGEFVLEIATAAPPTDGSAAMANTDAFPPVLPVNPRDVVTLSGADSTGTLTVETTKPVFSSFAPAHNTSGRDDRPEVTAQVTDGDSGLTDKNIDVIFVITEGGTSKTVTKNPKSDGDVYTIPGGFEVRQRYSGSDAPSGDATIEWWVKATDNAGNVGYSDRQASIDGVENPCTADGSTSVSGLADAGCQSYKILIDTTQPSLVSVSISHTTPGAAPLVRINSPISVTATFSGPVLSFTVDDVSVANGVAGNFDGSDGSSVYTFEVTPNAIGAVTVDIAAGAAQDTDGNGNIAAAQLSLGIPYDDDGDGTINQTEVLTAVADYFRGALSALQVLAVVSLYFTSG